MQALVIDKVITEKLLALDQYAKDHPFTFDQVKLITMGIQQEPEKAFRLSIPIGFYVRITYEEQENKWMRHIAITCIDHLPAVGAFMQIAELIGVTEEDIINGGRFSLEENTVHLHVLIK